MKVKFLGVRGSTATPGKDFSHFGGNTSCTVVNHEKFQIIIDAGTGFQRVNIRQDVPVLVLFSHFHFDHVQGLPFCRDLLALNTPIYFSSALVQKEELKAILSDCFSPHYFPIELIQNLDHIKFLEFKEATKIIKENCEIESVELIHPGGASGYSLKTNSSHFCYFLDHEFENQSADRLRSIAKNANLVIWDGMFTDEELTNRKGWGHSSIEQGFKFLENCEVKSMAMSHHSPYRNDKSMFELDLLIKKKNVYKRTKVFLAREETEIEL